AGAGEGRHQGRLPRLHHRGPLRRRLRPRLRAEVQEPAVHRRHREDLTMATPSGARRLAFLEKAVEDKAADPFAWYGLAVEYGNVGRHDDSLRTFQTLRASHPDYVPMYLGCGQMLQTAGRTD